MRLLKNLSALTLLLAALLAAACGGGGAQRGEGGGAQRGEGGAASEPLLYNAPQVLGASARAFEEDVQSVRAEMGFDISFGEFALSGQGDLSYQAPDQIHMTFSLGAGGASSIDLSQLGNFELLLLGDRFYLNSGLTGWLTASLQDLGVEADAMREFQSIHSPVDYGALLREAGGDVQYLGEEEVGGARTGHYRLTMDAGDFLESLSSTLSSGGGIFRSLEAALPKISGSIEADVWVEADTLLPQKLQAVGDLTLSEQAMSMSMEARFYDYNQPLRLPEPPEDAKPLQDMSGG